MIRLKPSVPLVWTGLCLATLSAEISLLVRARAGANKVGVALEQKIQERDRLLRQTPAPSVENEKAIEAALDAATRTLAAMREELGGKQEAGPVPGGSVEAFFDLNRFVAEMRRRAAGAQVVVKPTECFGFSSYAHEGPPAALLSAVHRQRAGATVLIEALLEARPLALLAVKREQPGAAGDEKPGPATGDCFAWPREHSLRQPGLVDTDAFRLEFTGQTAVLRQFLSTLAGSRPTVVVRTVEVEPYHAGAATPSQAGVTTGALQRPQISKFTVTLEIPLIASTENPP